MKYIYILPLSIILSCTTQAEELGNAGFGGEFGLIAGFTGGKTNFNLNNKTKNGALNSKGKSDSTALFYPVGTIQYTFGNQNSQQLYLGMPDNSLLKEVMALELGYQLVFTDESELILSYSPTLRDGETWRNPYQTDTKREKTDISGDIYSIGYNNIFNIGIASRVYYYDKDIDIEQSGAQALKRSGDGYLVKLSMGLPINDIDFIEPEIFFHSYSADGKAMAFDEYGLSISYMMMVGSESFSASVEYAKADFDSSNPVFNKTQENQNYEFNLMHEYNDIMGWRDWKFNTLLGYSITNSNINFYDENEYMVGFGLTHSF